MPNSGANPRRVITIAGPLVSFVVLAVVVVSAVVVGNLRERSANDCWSAGRSSAVGDESQSWPVMVWSEGDSALMLCDVGAETVKYEPPEESGSRVLVGKAMFRLHTGDEIVLPDSLIGKVEGNDLTRSDLRIPLYKKGEFGEVADCYGDPDGLKDGDGIWNEDPFGVYSDPDAIQSCWLEFEDTDDWK